MSLEDKLEEGFISGFARKFWSFSMPVITSFIIGGCGEKGKKVSGPEYEGKSKEEVVVTTKSTDNYGQVQFVDSERPEESVTIQVVNSNDEEIREDDLRITHEDYNNVNAYFLNLSKGYLPSKLFVSDDSKLRSKPLVSEYRIKTGKSEEFGGIFYIDKIQGKDGIELVVHWKGDRYGWTEHTYEGTISKDTKIKIDKSLGALCDLYFKGILYFFGVDVSVSPSNLISRIPEKIDAERWDVYGYCGENIAPSKDVIPSNVPEFKELKIESENNGKIVVSWEGYDETSYKDVPIYFPIREDLTVLLGRSKKNDLDFVYKVYRDGEVVKEGKSIEDGFVLNGLENGKYTLEGFVVDEVGNKSESKKEIFWSKTDADDVKSEKIPEGAMLAYLKNSSSTDSDYICIREFFGDIENLGEERIIYELKGWLEYLSFSPDGSKLAFVKTPYEHDSWSYPGQVSLINIDGNNLRGITPMEPYLTNLSWSPDGKQIVYCKGHYEDNSDIFIVDINSRYINRLTYTEDLSENYPVYSPDGRRIACTSIDIRNLNLRKVPFYLDIYDASGDFIDRFDISRDTKSVWFDNSIILFDNYFANVDQRKIIGKMCGLSSWEDWSPNKEMLVYAFDGSVYTNDVIDGSGECFKEITNEKIILQYKSDNYYFSPTLYISD